MKKKKSGFVRLAGAVVILSIVLAVFFGIGYVYSIKNIDFSADEALFDSNRSTNVTRFYYDAGDGDKYEPQELFSITQAETKKVWFPYESIGDNVKMAIIAAEDREFFSHHGINLKRTIYAAINHIFRIKPSFGASTITQQVIKNISGDSEKTLTRKMNELIRALHIENHYSKEDILELYMNIVPMGSGLAGIGLGAEYYFGKSADELSLAEAATLAGIINAPTRYNPHTNPEKCISKRNNVLYAMLDFGVIDQDEYERAITKPLGVIDAPQKRSSIRSWFIETVYEEVRDDLAEKLGISKSAAAIMVSCGGLSIYTTQNPDIQSALEAYFENEANLPGAVNNGLKFAMTVVDSKSGNLLGIIGDAGQKRANRILNYATSPHPPASTLKPLALYAPLLDSKRIKWSTVFDDTPVTFYEGENGEYIKYPQNFPAVYSGLTTVADAIRVSKNTVAVRLYNLLGKESIYKSLKENFDFDSLVEQLVLEDGRVVTDLAPSPLALGQLTNGVSLRTLTEAYTVFPGEGVFNGGRSYIAVFDSKGKPLIEKGREEKQVFRKEAANIVNQLLMRVTESGTAKAITLNEILDTAGKTGTSAGDQDRLFVGYTPYYTAGIWCGYADGQTAITVDRKTHLEIWDAIMKEIHERTLGTAENYEGFSTDSLLYLPYCRDSGDLHGDACELDLRGSRLEYGYFEEDNKPTHRCQCHVICYMDELTGKLATFDGEYETLRKISLIDVKDRNFPTEVAVGDDKYRLDLWIAAADTGIPDFPILDNSYAKRRRGIFHN